MNPAILLTLQALFPKRAVPALLAALGPGVVRPQELAGFLSGPGPAPPGEGGRRPRARRGRGRLGAR